MQFLSFQDAVSCDCMCAVTQNTVLLVWHSNGISSTSCACACNTISNSRYKPGQYRLIFNDWLQFWNNNPKNACLGLHFIYGSLGPLKSISHTHLDHFICFNTVNGYVEQTQTVEHQ